MTKAIAKRFDPSRRNFSLWAWFILAVFLILSAYRAHAADRTVELVARDGRFSPEVLELNVGEKIELILKNEGSDAEEFESIELKREKIIPPGKSATVKIGPLKAGVYPFFGDFHPQTARGQIVVK